MVRIFFGYILEIRKCEVFYNLIWGPHIRQHIPNHHQPPTCRLAFVLVGVDWWSKCQHLDKVQRSLIPFKRWLMNWLKVLAQCLGPLI